MKGGEGGRSGEVEEDEEGRSDNYSYIIAGLVKFLNNIPID